MYIYHARNIVIFKGRGKLIQNLDRHNKKKTKKKNTPLPQTFKLIIRWVKWGWGGVPKILHVHVILVPKTSILVHFPTFF